MISVLKLHALRISYTLDRSLKNAMLVKHGYTLIKNALKDRWIFPYNNRMTVNRRALHQKKMTVMKMMLIWRPNSDALKEEVPRLLLRLKNKVGFSVRVISLAIAHQVIKPQNLSLFKSVERACFKVLTLVASSG